MLSAMDLILWRHADAAPVTNDSEPDIGRRLTGKGRKQAALMAIWLERHLPDSVKVLASPAMRARETAEALGRKVVIMPTLAMGADATQVLHAAGWPDNRQAVPNADLPRGQDDVTGDVECDRVRPGRRIG